MKKKGLPVTCIILLITLLVGCGKKEITEIYLQKEDLALEIGESATLTYTHFPTDASTEGVSFTSINPDIATVDESGLVLGVSSGKTRIVVSSEDGVTASCEVTVKEQSAIEQLNEHETRLFECMINHLLPSFYNAPAARVLNVYGRVYERSVTVEIQGTNKVGGTINNYYSILYEGNVCLDCTDIMNAMDETEKKADLVDSTIIEVTKINRALEEYWERKGM